MGAIVDQLTPDMFNRLLENLAPDDRNNFIRVLAKYAKDRALSRAKFQTIIEGIKSFGLGIDFQVQGLDSHISQPISHRVEVQNVTVVTPDVAHGKVAVNSPMNRHNVTVTTARVTHPVAQSRVLIRIKRGEDGFYHCQECDYVTERAGTLRMHRFRKHRKIVCDGT